MKLTLSFFAFGMIIASAHAVEEQRLRLMTGPYNEPEQSFRVGPNPENDQLRPIASAIPATEAVQDYLDSLPHKNGTQKYNCFGKVSTESRSAGGVHRMLFSIRDCESVK